MTNDPNGTSTPRGDWRDALPEDVDRSSLPAIRRVQLDSRAVEAGDLFVCIPGERADGHDFAARAVEAGAVALVAATDRAEGLRNLGVPVVGVPSPRVALAAIAAAHEGYPGRALTVVGITGTDGKSTTAFLTLAALEAAGLAAGLLSTIESRIRGEVVPIEARLTTQEAPVVQRLLGDMVAAGCTHAVVEATSHGLALHRLDHCYFDVGVLTNVTPDHLDFHGTFESYRKAKGALFEMLNDQPHGAPQRTAVLNRDDPNWQYFAARTKARVVTYGVDNEDADVRIADVMAWSDGSTFSLTAGDDDIEASVRLPGEFNVSNAAAAITAAAALNLEIEQVAAGVAACPGVPGRMERITGAPFDVIVDYAHTPEAMRRVLGTLRDVVDGRLVVLFGCAGERSRDRRTGLGAVAAELADYVVLTEEDPRSEPSEQIIEEIAQALIAAGASEGASEGATSGCAFERVTDRRDAIARALEIARPGDLLLLAGKGHERSIERADGAHPWDDRAVAREEIARRFGPQDS
ncbi:MAG: UDP-N-acetylmuramoyl-L-alanyl-D-glutamate--2,6-diaminopimelate ligase [Chloroflexi bacterium]|nr:UDP-N-acetylmuramoyl-L-alanyl-D-glutamate--2,6-diaminopimelate ligase [Chloroflexota bacterium]MDA1146674.1 UDP-N-acetylmuramoyl-L-alanyl-D-glutamate--2,6-diaminopimelate ligase [Chloroflexota bacterium]MQC82783.1 UDP-N-acetylmuramoyl-L-alanyl-D-glutamate--2,6-diaminopimelate ligase [Chloroflexota bacterium]